MKKKPYQGPERRKFIRLDYMTPLAYKICTKETISKLLQGYTADVSAAGLLCSIKDKVHIGDILWLAFDRGTLSICEEIENRCLIYQNGVIGKVVRERTLKDNAHEIGIQFLTREEKNLTHIYPKIHFLKLQGKEIDSAVGDGQESNDESLSGPELGTGEEKTEQETEEEQEE